MGEFEAVFVNLKEFLCIWRIKNYNFSCLFNYKSPIFKVDSLEKCEWSLHLWVKHHTEGLIWKLEKKTIMCQLSLHKCPPEKENIDLNFWYELTNADGDFLITSQKFDGTFENGNFAEQCELIELDDLMKEMSNSPDDTLVLRCYMSSNIDDRSVSIENRPVTSCEIETTAQLHAVPFEWHFKFSSFESWSVIKNVSLTNLSLKITFKYVIDKIQVEISSDIKDNCEHLLVCDIAILNSHGTKITSYEHYGLLRNNNNIWRFPSSITKDHLEMADCFNLEEIRMRLRLTHPYSSKISYLKDSENDRNTGFKKDNCGRVNSSFSDGSMTASKTHDFSYLRQDLQNLLLNKQFSDVRLQVGNEIFHAHKLLLSARSPVFSNIFKQDTALTVLDIETDIDTLKCFLEYIYTCEIQEMDEKIALKLLILADKYQVLPLFEKCSKFLQSVLCPRNVCQILSVAEEENYENLKFSAVDCIVENSLELLSSPEWSQLLKINGALATVILFRVSNKLAKNDKEESMPGSSKEVSWPSVSSRKTENDAGSSKEVLRQPQKLPSSQSQKSCSTMPEPEGRQLNTP